MTSHTRQQATIPSQLVARWNEHLIRCVKTRTIARTTQTSYLGAVQRFARWCEENECNWTKALTIERWQKALLAMGYRAGSVNTWLAGVKAFFRWTVDNEYLESSPTEGLNSAVESSKEERHRLPLTESEVRSLMAQPDESDAGKRDRAILALMVYTALRTIDVQYASIGDLENTERGRIFLALGDRSDNDVTHATLDIAPQRALDYLCAWLAVHPRSEERKAPLFISLGNRSHGQRLASRTIRRLVRAYLLDAGIDHPRKTTQSLRYSAIQSALNSGARLERVQTLSRHSSLTSLQSHIERVSDKDQTET